MNFANDDLKKEWHNNRQMFWPFKMWFEALNLAYYQAFEKQFTITSLGRSCNPKSAHCQTDKLVCAVDVRTNVIMEFEELRWLANLQESGIFKPYFDIVIEDERWDNMQHPRGDHIHFELNPKWWFNF